MNVYCVYLLCVYNNTHTCRIYFENIHIFIFVYIYILFVIFTVLFSHLADIYYIYKILYLLYLIYKRIFLKYINACVCIFIYTLYTHIYYVNKNLNLDAINL